MLQYNRLSYVRISICVYSSGDGVNLINVQSSVDWYVPIHLDPYSMTQY